LAFSDVVDMVKWLHFLLAGLALCLPGMALGQAFTLMNLGQPDWNYSEAHGLNNLDNAVGEFATTNAFTTTHAFFFVNGAMTDLGFADGTEVAYAVNDSNVVVGQAGFMLVHGFVYSTGVTTDLPPLGGAGLAAYGGAFAINRAGLIVGESTTSLLPNSAIHATLWNGATVNNLGVLPGGAAAALYSSAFGINNSNVIVGESDYVPSPGVTNTLAFVYTNSVTGMKDLGTLGGNYSSARSINDSGVIVGESSLSGDVDVHAFVWQNGSMTDLGTLGGSTSSASAINSAGQIVGYAADAAGMSHAFLYIGGKMLNLNDHLQPGSVFTNLATADGINDAGQITGTGYTTDPVNYYQAYVLTPAAPWISLAFPLITNGQFQCTVFGTLGQSFAIRAFTNLADTNSAKWVWLGTNILTGTSTNFTDTGTTSHGRRYYRARLLP
jgi:probable HAF family extracellular repeat protein